ncbi:MAG TPA: Type 1 glutamine amidotransferase-like domain-containing protein, partial [Longimicrobiales bacterium]|nr:Type 1 glutamine amidotransferase-like domain-containing protein [Longimicrobiales bacterium]
MRIPARARARASARRGLAVAGPLLLVLSLEAAWPGGAAAQSPASLDGPRVGPASGALVAVGGAMRSPEIYRRFIELAGGRNAHIVLVPTAGNATEYDDSWAGLEAWRNQGARNLTLLHTTDPREADTDRFVEPLRDADAVFFFGGRQWRLVDAYAGTRTESELRSVLERGGVIGGT